VLLQLSGPFYVLGQPWIDRRSLPTGILYGCDDPHVGRHFADTSCLTGCQNCEEWETSYEGSNPEVHAEDAIWLVEALNFAVRHPEGPGQPPFEVRRIQQELKAKQDSCRHRWEMADPMDMDVCEYCQAERKNPNARLP
jgi:hypothetical protein